MSADLHPKLSSDALTKVAGTPLEHDVGKLEQLAQIVPEEQANAVRRHLSFESPWEGALEGLTLRSDVERTKPTQVPEDPSPPPSTTGTAEQPAPAAPTAKAAEQPAVPAVTRRIESWPLGKLKPNRFNAMLFPDSLSESSIASMADDLAKNGQRVAVEATPDGTLIDGERRWRAAVRREWKLIDVAVGKTLSDDELLDRVLDSCTSTRQMTVREQTNVYVALCERFKRDAGRQQGRPPAKTFQKGNVFLTAAEVRKAAAKQAGLSSAAVALRAEAVFTKGSTELQDRVLDGSLTVTAAYDELPKRPKKKPMPKPGVEREKAISESSKTPPDQPAPSAPAKPDEPVVPVEAGDSHLPGSNDGVLPELPEVATNPRAEADDEAGQPAEPNEESLGDPIFDVAGPDEDERQNVNDHVSAICAHIGLLAERDYDEATAWLDDVVEQMRASLGERPESDEVEQPDDLADNFDELQDW